MRELRDRGVVWSGTSHYTHSYPHCWRCDTPLVYKAVSSWFVAVTRFKERMVRAQPADQLDARARQGRLVRQVAGQRARLVDQPQPVLGFADPGVEVRRPGVPARRRLRLARPAGGRLRRAGDRPAPARHRRADPAQPGRPDRHARPCGGCRRCSTAGSSPGRCRSPRCTTRSRTREWFENHYPGDFIVEYIRPGPRLVLHHARAGHGAVRPAGVPQRVVHGIVLGDDGRKMSKSLRNYPDVYEMFDAYGSDAMRWTLMSSPVLRGGDMAVTESAIRDSVRQVLLPLWNVYYFFTLYANAEGYTATGAPTRRTYSTGTCWPRLVNWSPRQPRGWTSTTSRGACAAVRGYLDALTNWYVRRSRDRFWAGDRDAFDTLYTVLETVARVMAPLAPIDRRGDLARPDRRPLGAPGRLAGRAVRSRPTTSWWRRWTRSARSARPRCRCARRAGCGYGCRSRR